VKKESITPLTAKATSTSTTEMSISTLFGIHWQKYKGKLEIKTKKGISNA